MLKIDSQKIWKLLKEDTMIQKELIKFIKEEQNKLNKAKEDYQNQFEIVENLKMKQKNLELKENELNTQIVNLNAVISFIEVKKLILESRIKRLKRLIISTQSLKLKKKFQKRIEGLKEEFKNYENEQKHIGNDIIELQQEQQKTREEKRNTKENIYRGLDNLEKEEQNVFFWQSKLETKENKFYKLSFERVTENFGACQNLIVPDLEKSKKISKEEAVKKANPIIIDEESILSSPDQIKVRKLTKKEKENYRKIS